MNTPIRRLLSTLAAASMLFVAGGASADRGDRGERDFRARQEWRDHDHRHHWKHDERRHWKRHHRHHERYARWADHRGPVVIKERVVVRERPVYRSYEPRRTYRYSEPAIVIGFDIPPFVIPLR